MPPIPSRMTIFAAAMTSGVLLGLLAHMLSGLAGIGLTSIWQDLFPTDANAVRSALGWWLIAGAGFAGSFLAGMLTLHWSGSRRRLVGMLFFLVLAGAPYLAAALPAPNLPFALGANLAAVALATLTAFCGSWFAQPR